MAERLVSVDLNFQGIAKPTNVPTPVNAGDGAPKSYVDGRTPKTTVSTTAPASPAVGDVWIDIS